MSYRVLPSQTFGGAVVSCTKRNYGSSQNKIFESGFWNAKKVWILDQKFIRFFLLSKGVNRVFFPQSRITLNAIMTISKEESRALRQIIWPSYQVSLFLRTFSVLLEIQRIIRLSLDHPPQNTHCENLHISKYIVNVHIYRNALTLLRVASSYLHFRSRRRKWSTIRQIFPLKYEFYFIRWIHSEKVWFVYMGCRLPT